MSENQEPPVTVSIAEARKNLAQVLKLVQAGTTVYLTRRDKIVAALQPIYPGSPGGPDAAQP